MFDRIRIKPDRLYLTDEASDQDYTVEGFNRRLKSRGREKPSNMIITLDVSGSDILRIISRRLDCGRWQVTCLDINLPALLLGHNATGIQTHHDLALALTRARHFVSLVTEPSDHKRILPSSDWQNNGYIQKAELMIQIQDPKHRILIGSHLCSKRYQHRSHLVCWEQSTYVKGDDLAINFYDKAAQRNCSNVSPRNVPCTRIECLVKDPERLANEVALTNKFHGEPGEVVRTISMDTAYAIIRRNVSQLTGFDQLISDQRVKGNKIADTLFIGLRERVHESHELDWALEEYRRLHKPCQRTFKEISKALRSMAVNLVTDQTRDPLPENRGSLLWSSIPHHSVENTFAALRRDLQAPDTPDERIQAAWATTSLIKSKPTSLELTGDNLIPFTPPWRTHTL